MNKKEILLICLILCFICAVPAVSAADVNSTSDDVVTTSDSDVVSVDNDLSSYSLPDNNQVLRGENDDAGSFSDLQNEIDNYGSTHVVLSSNYTYNVTSDIAMTTTGVVINGDYVIEGQEGKNITINGLGKSKLFTLTGTITFKNINFVRGFSNDDAPVHSTGMLTVEDSTFTGCSGINGGAIHALDGLNVSGTDFANNKAQEGGSIFISDSSLTSIISDCTFSGDKALTDNGGSISSATSFLTLRNLIFNGCSAANDGGAIILSGHNNTLDNVNISNCKASNNGGAIYFRHNHKLLSNLRFENNRALNYGGAIYCYPECEGTDDGGLVNVTFIGNIAGVTGGAMHVSGNNGRIVNGTFTNNRATNGGGAILINGTGWRVYNSSFTSNFATMGHGGAVYIDSGTGIIIDYCNFTSNSAGYGGGAVNSYNNTHNGIINNSRFISNTANAGDGGGIYWSGDNVNIERSYFTNNKATSIGPDTGFGGAISLSGSYDTITNCTFIRNTASLGGGAIVVKNAPDTEQSTNATIIGSVFEYNQAGRDGGAISWNSHCINGTVINSTFKYNTASGSAGALGLQGDYGTVYNSTFIGNEAFGTYSGDHPGDGGAMYFVGNHNYAYNCTFANNTAANHGGAAYIKSTDIHNNNDTTFDYCRFINNLAKKNGGAVDWSSGSIYGNIFNSEFTNNTAWRSGGAVYWRGTFGRVLNSSFNYNKAVGAVSDASGGGDGGSILWLGSHGQVDNCNFTNNFAQYRGGAVFLKGEPNCNDTKFTHCLFINNTAGLNGGGIDWQVGANNGRLEHSLFINNTAWRSGGGVYWYGTNGTINDCNFTNNRAEGNVTKDARVYMDNVYTTVGGNGGAVVWTGSLGYMSYVNFESNYAKRLGGAIYLQENENGTFRYANFTDNYAGINGGAIDWAKGAVNGRVEHAVFINNTAKRSGGAIYWYGHNGTLYDVVFIDNDALGQEHYINPFGENTTGGDGGAIFWTGYNGNVILSKFINNSAAKRGGAVFLQGSTEYPCNNTRFVTALFENNTAGTNGGAVDWFKGATHGLIDNATFNNNVANRSGGAIYWNGDYGDVLNSNFTNNRAKGMTWAINAYGENTTGGSGGAIIWSGSQGEVINCIFKDNNASKHGGAVYLQGTSEENCTNTTFDRCYFEGNNATVNGGAIDWHHGSRDGLLNNSYLINNRAGANGGAIYWQGHNGYIWNSNFTENYALGIIMDGEGNQGDGGAVIWSGLNGTVENCWFTFNEASHRGGAVYLHACKHGNDNTTFDNTHFINNTAGTNGGAIDWYAGAEHGCVNNSEFINNTAGVNGGAIFWNGHDGDILNSNFTTNFATQNGGAVYWEGDIGIIAGSRFEYNWISGDWNKSTPTIYYLNPNTGINEAHYNITGGDGGAIIWKGSHGIIENTTFYKNYAPYRGGAIFFTNLGDENCTNMTIKAANFTENYAAMNGGALDWSRGAHDANILDSYFINNTADRSAGAIYVSGDDLDLENTIFENNRITGKTKYDNRTGVSNYTSIGGNGGAICWMGSYGDVVNVTFLNNTATQRGGAIQFERNKNGTIKDSRFENNSAGTEGGAIDFYNGAENGRIINSNFTNNHAQQNGGAIYWQGHHGIINGSRFENNTVSGLGDGALVSTTVNPNTGAEEKRYNITGGDGGAIKWTGSHGIIENTTFYQNTATYNGGALYLIGNSTENCTNITFIDCDFTDNLAKLNGGAVFWASGASNATVSDSRFINNTAYRSAGAIYISGNYLEIEDSDFEYNDATSEQTYDNRTGSSYFTSLGGNGGAICWMGSFGTVDNGTFINNTAADRGGAIQFERNENGTVKNSYFENNSAYDDGGAIDWYEGAVNGQLINSTFITNYITGPNGRGSGVYIEGYNATIKDSRFFKHNANADGGVIYIEGDEATVDNSTFENITSRKNGGAIYVAGHNTTITESEFSHISADLDGGAIYISGESADVTSSTFDNCSATNGGVMYISGHDVLIDNVTMTNNRARKDGSALYITGNDCELYNSKLTNNTAGDDAAIYWDGDRGYVSNITCYNNTGISNGTSSSKGGTICLTGDNATITKSSFTISSVIKDSGDLTDVLGGAIFVSGNLANITDSTFDRCSAAKDGGSIYIIGNDTNVLNCTFEDSKAIDGGTIYVSGHNATIANSSVKNSNASLSGGAIYIKGLDAVIDNSTFEDTNAFGSTNNGGGAIFIEGDSAVVERSNFTNNFANSNSHAIGGALYITGDNVNVTESNFVNSKANLRGGAIYINGANTTIRDSNFTKTSLDTANSQGGAIYVDGINARIIGSDFNECSALESGGSIYITGINTTIQNSNFTKSKTTSSTSDGGAIYVNGNYATINASSFVDSQAKDMGGAIYILGSFSQITGSNISTSKADSGAGIYIEGNNATVNDTNFYSNIASVAGGGIYSNGIGSKVYNSNFTENQGDLVETMGHGGGAIYWVGGAEGDTIENCTFLTNKAAFGGAIRWVNKQGVSASGLIKNCTFDDNFGHKGSVISWASSNSALITECTFKNNYAYKNGCIYAGSNGLGATGVGFTISDCIFENNSADFCGGDIANAMAYAVIKNCNFTGSTAGYGGSIVLRESSPKGTQIINCTFINTTSSILSHNDNGRFGGGAIYLEQNYVDIKVINVTIINSTSTTDGGAIKWVGDSGTLENVTIINASATGTYKNNNGIGGGILWTGKNGKFINVTVINATSKTNGGGIYVGGESLDISKSNIINSTAKQSGGGIYWASAKGKISNSNITNNSAVNGGGIYWAGSNGEVSNSLFTDNKATDGGAIYWNGANGKLIETKFIKNHATHGGAVYWKAASSTFTQNELYNNTADYGGAVYWDLEGGSIENSIMMYNRAINGSAMYVKQTIGDVINTTFLENQALSYEIYNTKTTVIERSGNTITVFTLFRGGDNVLNAIYNAANAIYFTNVTYLGYNGTRNTRENGRKVTPVVLSGDELPSVEDEIYQTNLEVYQDVYTYAYDGNNALKMNVTQKTDYRGAVAFTYTDESFRADYLNVKVFHPEDNYYTYIAFANTTKLPSVLVEGEDIFFHETEYINITVRPANSTETECVCPGNVTIYLNGEIYKANVSLAQDGTWGTVTIPISGLHVGTYNVYVAYSGNDKYIPEYNSTTFNVLKINSTINVTVPDYYYGESQKVIIRTIENASNNVSIILNGKQYWIEVDDTGYAELDIPLLNAGNYTVEAFYPDSRDCYESGNSTTFEVWKVNSTIEITAEYDDRYNTVIMHVDVGPSDTVGNVVVTFNGKEYKLSLGNSTADLTVMNVPRGQYNVSAQYDGDMNHWGSNNTTVINATKYIAPIDIDAMNITYGENETIVFTLPSGVTGNLTITINNQTFTREIIEGIVILENMILPAGTYNVTASYPGDDNYASSTSQAMFIVAKAVPEMDPRVENITYGDVEHIVDSINQTGNISIIIRDLVTGDIILQNLTINITDGNVTWDIPDLARGEYLAEFIFSGNQNYTGCTVNRTFVVGYATTLIIVEVADIKVGENATINVTVYPQGKVTGNVTIYVDGINVGNFTLDENSFTQLFNVSGLLNGTHDAVAVYHGDGNYTHRDNSTTFGVYKHDALMNVTGINVTVFDDEIITVNLPVNATGIIYLKVNGTSYYINLTAGERSINLGKLGNGTYEVYANYTGDYYWNSVSNTTTFTISKVPSSINVTVEDIIVGDKAIINITTSEGICGNVTVNVNGTNYTAYVSGGHGLLVLDNLGVGEYPVNVTFAGCAKYGPSFNATSFKVSKVNVTTDIHVVDQGNGTVVVILPSNATGNVTITLENGTNFTAPVVNGTAVITLENVTPGLNNITVVYSGDDKHNNVTLNATVDIPKYDTPITVDVVEVYNNGTAVLNITVPKDAVGNVTVTVDGKEYTVELVNGSAVVTVGNLTVGDKTVVVEYLGDANFTSNYTVFKFTVDTVVSTPEIFVVDLGNGTVVVYVGDNATGNVTITLEDGTNFTAPVVNGTAVITLENVTPGLNNVTVIYSGDDKHNNVTLNATVDIPKYDTPITVDVVNVYNNGTAVLNITVPKDAVGNVTVTVDGKEYTVELVNGSAIVTVGNLTVGDKTVVVEYPGDSNYTSNYTVSNFTVDTVVSTPEIFVVDLGNSTVVVYVSDNATGNVTITLEDGTNFTAPVVNGTVVITLENVTPGLNNVTVIYSGDDKHNNVTLNATVDIPKFDTLITVEVVEVYTNGTAVLNITVPKDAIGNVTVTVDGKEYTVELVNGSAIVTVGNLTVGDKTVVVEYPGDSNYTANYTVSKFTVDTVVSTPDIIVIDQGNGTVVVYVGDNATGNVTITLEDGTNFTAPIVNGTAVITLENVTPGLNNITVVYSGDDKHNNVTLNATVDIPKYDTPITVEVVEVYNNGTAVLNITVPKDAKGNVTVTVDGKEYVAEIVNGSAVVTVGNLTVGDKTVVVEYPGDSNYTANYTVSKFTVDTVVSTPDIIVIDQGNGTVVVYVGDNATGNVTITLEDGTNFTAPIVNGTAVITLENVTPGLNNITVVYSGDDKHNNVTLNATVDIPKYDTPITVEVVEVYNNGTAVLNITVPKDATGNVTVTVDGKEYTVEIVNGSAVVTVVNLTVGDKTVVVEYPGDSNYTSNYTVSKFTVDTVVSTPDIMVIDQGNGTVVVVVGDNATGNVTITLEDGTNFTAPVVNGTAVITLENVTPGLNNITVVYSGDEKYNNVTLNATVNIPKLITPISVNATDIYVGDTAVVTVRLPAGATGNVTIKINGVSYTNSTIVNGIATFNVAGLAYGNKTVAVRYYGDSVYSANYTDTNFTVSKRQAYVNVTAHDINVGEIETVDLTVPLNATGEVIININGTTYAVNVTDGIGSIQIKCLESGTYRLNVTYIGDDQYLSSENNTVEFTVSKLQPVFAVSGINITYGEKEIITIETEENITGVVKVQIANRNYTAFIIEGKGNLTVENLAAGEYNVSVYFAGNKKYMNATASNKFEIAKAVIAVIVVPQNITYGEEEVVTVYVNATGTVDLTVDGDTRHNWEIVDGKVVIPVLGYLSAGNYTAYAAYSGNENYTVSYGQANFTVAKKDPVITIEVQNITYGDVEHIVVHVNASGNVTIKVNGTSQTIELKEDNSAIIILRSAVNNIPKFDGKAHEYIYNLNVGEYPVEVMYSGNENFNEATATSLFFVNKADTTLSIGVDNITVGESQTITVIINNTNATGEVVFNVDGINYTRPITNGAANLTLDKLAYGNHSVVAIYRGDNNLRGNWTSAIFSVDKVKPEISVDVHDVTVGETEHIVVHIPDNATGFVVIDVDGTKYHIDIVEGQNTVTLDIDDLYNKTYEVTAEYYGDDNYTVAKASNSFNVSKIKSNVSISVENITVGDKAIINITTPEDLCGNVTVVVDGEEYTVFVSGGHGILILTDLEVGNHTADVIFDGSRKYEPSNDTTKFTVSPVDAIPADIHVVDQGNGTVVVVVGDNAIGNVTIVLEDGSNVTVPVVNGTAVITLENATPGINNITVIYSGDDIHSNATLNATVDIPKYDAPITVDVVEVYNNGTAVLNITVPKDATGNVTVSVDGKEYTAEIVNGSAVVTVGNLTVGDKTVVVEYPGDDNYRDNYTVSKFTVDTVVSTPDITVIDQGNGTVVVVVGDNATGNVTIVLEDGTNFTAPVVNGTAVITLENATPGLNNVTVIYSGDDKHNNATLNATVDIPKYDAPITVDVVEVYNNGTAVLNITVPKDATGNVTVTVDGKEYIGEIVKGSAVVTVGNLTVGDKTVVVEYPGDDNYADNYTVSKFTVDTVVSTPDIVVIDQGNGTVVVYVGDNATGNVTITLEDGTNFTAPVVNGTAVITLENATPGLNNITVIYSGDDKHNNATLNDTADVPKYDAPITVDVVEVYNNGTAVLNITVPKDATGNVTVTVDGKEYIGEIVNGSAVVTVGNLTVGDKTVVVEYPGDANYTANYTVSKFTVDTVVSTPEIFVVDQGNGTLVVHVSDNATGNVTVKIGDNSYGAVIVNGTAVINVDNETPGIHDAEVIYSGDDKHNNATLNATVDIPRYDTSMTVDVVEVYNNGTAVLNITVPKDATGNVTVTVDGKEYIGEIVNGSAVVTVGNLTVGDKTVVVEYPGDDNYADNYTVSKFTVDTVVSTPDIVVIDQGNGTVVVVVGDNATGNVTITLEDGTNFTAPVVNGTAVITLENATPGLNNITIVYSGDDKHNNVTLNATVDVPKYDTPISVDVVDVYNNGTAILNITVPKDATGNVTVTVDGKEYIGEIVNGSAIVTVGNLTVGDKTVVVEYPGDDNYTANYTVSKFTVDTVVSTPEIFVVDQGNGTVVVHVSDNATGNVTVKIGDNTYEAVIVNGTAVVNVDNETPGIHDAEVIYSGDDKHNNATLNATVDIPKYDTTLSVDVVEVYNNGTAVLNITVPKDATGNVTVTVDGKEYTAEIVNGSAIVTVGNLTVGDKTVVVEYPGDDNYRDNYTVSKFTVDTVVSTPEIKVIDQGNGTVVVVVGDNATGNVTVKVGNNTYEAVIVNGTAVVNVDNETPGTHDVEVIYSGDDKHNNATVNATIETPKYETPIKVNISEIKVGENATVVVSVPENATGNITLYVDGVEHTSEIVNGIATFVIENLTAGNKTIAIEYAGDDNYCSNHTVSNITVVKCPSSVSAVITDINVGENVIVTVTVPEDATGQVLIDIDGVGYYVNVTDGIGTIEIPRMPNGIYNVNLTYTGDDKYLPSSNTSVFNVSKVKSFVIPVGQDIVVGDNEVITLFVPEDATGNVTVVIDGEEFIFDLSDEEILGSSDANRFSVAISGGHGKLVISGLPKGNYTISVKYNGDDKYLPSTNTTVFEVVKSDVSMEIIDQGNGTVVVVVGDNASGNVTITLEDGTNFTAPVVNGTASVTLTNATPGHHDIKVDYSGDGIHEKQTEDASVVIPKYDAPISVEVHDIYVGDTEVVTVTVPKGATGTITIEINGKEYSTENIVDGKAVFNVKGLAFGDKTVAVKYSGDENYRDNYTTGQFTVKKRPSTVTAKGKNIYVGTDEIITANVPKDATGKVLVEIDGVGYYANIINGVARVVIPELPSGKYTAKVIYEGDDKYLPSTNSVKFTVTKVNTPISAEGDVIPQGDDATVIVHLPNDATGTVTITVDGKTYTAEVDNGKAIFVVPGLTKGDWEVIAVYSGDKKYEANDTITDIEVIYAPTPDNPENNKEVSREQSQKDSNLSEYETGNPIFALLLVMLTLGVTQLRRFRK